MVGFARHARDARAKSCSFPPERKATPPGLRESNSVLGRG